MDINTVHMPRRNLPTRSSIFQAWWSIAINPRRDTLLRWSARAPVLWIPWSLLVSVAMWGVAVAFDSNINMLLGGDVSTLLHPVPTAERLFTFALWGGGAYLATTLVMAPLFALITPHEVGRFSARFWQALAVWTLSQVGPLTVNAIGGIALSLAISTPFVAAFLSPRSSTYNVLFSDIFKLLIAIIMFAIAGYVLVVTVQAGRASSGRSAGLVFTLQVVVGILVGLLIGWGVSMIGLHIPQ